MGIRVSAVTYFKGTEAGDQEWAGFEVSRRVVRYTLEITGAGASSLTLVHRYELYPDQTSAELCASLSRESDAFLNANGEENGYQAELVRDTTEKTYTLTLEGLKLYPGQVWYLWVYPKTDVYAFAYYRSGAEYYTLTAAGSLGVVAIETVDGQRLCLKKIWDGDRWRTYVLKVWTGTAWKLCTAPP